MVLENRVPFTGPIEEQTGLALRNVETVELMTSLLIQDNREFVAGN